MKAKPMHIMIAGLFAGQLSMVAYIFLRDGQTLAGIVAMVFSSIVAFLGCFGAVILEDRK